MFAPSTFRPGVTTEGGDVDPGDPAEATAGARYRLLDRLGRGGQGEVWRAEDRLTGDVVAVKLLADGEAARRETAFLRWAALPGVVPVLDEGWSEGRRYVVMPIVDGAPFPGRGVARTWATLRPRVASLLEGLARLHALGLVHRDLKPGNVMVDDDGRTTILDLGIADDATRPVGSGGLTPLYAAPEMLLGLDAGPAADVYAVGLMVAEALSGELPHDAGDLGSLVTQRCFMPLTLALSDPTATAWVRMLLATDPGARPTAREALRAAGGPADPVPADRFAGAASAQAWEAHFDGPDAFQHLREDAAALLWCRSDGDPARARAELGEWIRAGLASICDGRARMERSAIELVRAGALDADAVPPEPTRVLQRARRELRDGRWRATWSPALGVLRAARHRADPALEREALAVVAASALQSMSGRRLDEARFEAARTPDAATVAGAEALLTAARQRLTDPVMAAECITQVRPFADETLEEHRMSLHLWLCGEPEPGASDRWAGDAPGRQAVVTRLRALAAYRAGAWEEAATGFRRALGHRDSLGDRINLALVAVEAGLPDATELARAAMDEARGLREPVREVCATATWRDARYRGGNPLPVDPALVEAAHAVSPREAARMALTDAATAWRAGRCDASALARDAAERFERAGARGGVALGRALMVSAGAAGADLAPDRVPEALRPQVFALLAMAGRPVPATPLVFPRTHREILSADEIRRALAPSGSPDRVKTAHADPVRIEP